MDARTLLTGLNGTRVTVSEARTLLPGLITPTLASSDVPDRYYPSDLPLHPKGTVRPSSSQ